MMRFSWLISSGIAIFCVMMIQYFYQFKSDTGNLGVVGLALAIPFVLLCVFITFRYFFTLSQSAQDQFMRLLYTLIGIGFVAALFYFAKDYKETVFAELGGSTKDKSSSIYGQPLINIETSKIYFNFYTIAIVISISALVGTIVGMLRPSKKEDAEV